MSSELRLHLTQPDPALGALERLTPDGMAHWSGTGPPGTTCRQCVYWLGETYARAKPHELTPARCDLYIRLMRVALMTEAAPDFRIPHYTASCKHFDTSAFPPLPYRPKKPKADVVSNK